MTSIRTQASHLPKTGGSQGRKLSLPFLCAIMAAGFAPAQADPTPLPLWPGQPPKFAEAAKPETVDKSGNIENVSIPTITVYLPPKDQSTGLALVVCPGGSYRLLGWTTHVELTARYFNSKGIAVIGLKYRTSPPHKISPDDRTVPLMDLQRAIRIVRSHATEWNIDPHKIGVVGFSAGANLALTLASQFDEGDKQSGDTIEQLGSRPDFVIGCSAWHWRQKTSPFTFPANTPPVFLVHATDDTIAPIELPETVRKQLSDLAVPVHLEVYEDGGHGVGHLIPRRIEQNSPSSKWPEKLMEWLGGLGFLPKPALKSTPSGS